MKKLSKILLTFAFVLMLAVPFALIGCGEAKINEGIEIHTSFKTEYEVGDELDLNNGKIAYTDKEGKTTIIEITSSMVSSFSTATSGERDMILSYLDNTITVHYSVLPDAEIGAYYYANIDLPDGENSTVVRRLVFRFASKQRVDFWLGYLNTEIDVGSDGATQILINKQKIDHKLIYEGATAGNSGNQQLVATAKIAVLNETQLKVEMQWPLSETETLNIDKVLTKYVID